MRIVVFGTGDYYQRYKKWLVEEQVIALIDNSVEKQGRLIDGIHVYAPEHISELSYECVLILSFCYTEMRNQLLELGVDEGCIYHFYSIRKIIEWKKQKKKLIQYGMAERLVCSQKTNILLLSPELNNGGPAIALYYAALIFQKEGYNVLVASMIDGELRNQYLQMHIPVIIDSNLQVSVMEEEDWVNGFDLLLCNTLNFYVFLSKRNVEKPCIWWLHEVDFFYDGVDKKTLANVNFENLRIVAVGDLPKLALKKRRPDAIIENLLYCVDDERKKQVDNRKNIENILKIALVGYLEEIKGQDILLEAISRLSLEKRKKIQMFLVGQDKTLFGDYLKKKYAYLENVEYVGVINRKEIHRLYDEIDILVCPSRQDSMPTVVAEAMMHSKVSIISDAVGTKKYIMDGINGFIFQSESICELQKRIEWCVNHKDRLIDIGKMARKTYEKIFSKSAFEARLMGICGELLNDEELGNEDSDLRT